MKNPDRDIPPSLQPDPEDYGYDLDRALTAVVGLKTYVPQDAFTAGPLGTERAGSGVVVGASGLVVTIGYLITEAETIWITSADGRAVAGHALAYDQETGFGLVQALGRLDLPALEMGDSDRLKLGDPVVFAAAGGRHHAVETRVVGRQEFAGYWEYVLDEALFTAPSHPNWGGTALIGPRGDLIGIGSLQLQQAGEIAHLVAGDREQDIAGAQIRALGRSAIGEAHDHQPVLDFGGIKTEPRPRRCIAPAVFEQIVEDRLQ